MDIVENYLISKLIPSVYHYIIQIDSEEFVSNLKLILFISNIILSMYSIPRMVMFAQQLEDRHVKQFFDFFWNSEVLDGDATFALANTFTDAIASKQNSKLPEAMRWRTFIPLHDINPGILIERAIPSTQTQGNDVDRVGDIILITDVNKNEAGKTIGFVMNRPLNEQEDTEARSQLREATQHTEDFDLRHEKIKKAISNKTRVWLGVGGSHKNPDESWIHFHNCSHFRDTLKIGSDIVLYGNVFDILMDQECVVKLLYGSELWHPGQLESEIHKGVFKIIGFENKRALEFH